MDWRRRANRSDYFALSKSESNVREISQPVKISQLLGLPKQSESVKKIADSAIKSLPERTPYLKNKLGQKKNESTIKIRLPERITPYMKNISSQRTNGSTSKIHVPGGITCYQRSTSRKTETNVCNNLPYSERNVRRNLNFAEISSTMRTNTFTKLNKNPNDRPVVKNLRLSTRKSFLLAPNTIKDFHVKKKLKESKSVLISTMNAETRYSEISEGLESSVSSVTNINTHVDLTMCERSNKTSVIQHTSSQTFNKSSVKELNYSDLDLLNASNNDVLTKQILTNLNSDEIVDDEVFIRHNSNCNVTTNLPQLSPACNINARANADFHYEDLQRTYSLSDIEESRDTACSIGVEKEKCSSTSNCPEDWHLSLQAVESESLMNLQRGDDENDEHMTLSKTELTVFQSRLRHLICRLEEDLSNLKLTATFIENMLSKVTTTSKTIDDNKGKIKQLTIENLNGNTEVIRSKSPPHVTSNSSVDIKNDNKNNNPDDNKDENIPEETCKIPDTIVSNFSETYLSRENNSNAQPPPQINLISENDKENDEVLSVPINVQSAEPKSATKRRSARLMAKTLNKLNATNDSFVDLENELNIVNTQSNVTVLPVCTPVNKYKDKKVGRPLKEYMALKSRMSCLLTPNVKRFQSLEAENNACSETGGAKISLSNKILAELHNLYADSPEPK